MTTEMAKERMSDREKVWDTTHAVLEEWTEERRQFTLYNVTQEVRRRLGRGRTGRYRELHDLDVDRPWDHGRRRWLPQQRLSFTLSALFSCSAARALGKSRTLVQRWIKRYGLDARAWR